MRTFASFPTSVRFEVLGAVGATDGTGTLALGGPKQRTVLAMLVAGHPNAVSADTLVDALYGEEPHDKAGRTIQSYISNLRRVLGANTIERAGIGWILRCEPSAIDAWQFEDQVLGQSGDDEHPAATSRRLTAALELWHGYPYADVEAHGLLDAEITRLNELRLSALCARLDADLESGRHSDLIGELEALLASHPYDERLRGQHMLALYRAGRQKEALRSFRNMREVLVDELGVEPGPALQQLELQILEQSPDLDLTVPVTLETRPIVAVDVGDPFSSASDHIAETIEGAIAANGGQVLGPAGTASYGKFDEIAEAIATATQLARNGDGLRIAVDLGEVEVAGEKVSGPPLSRCARLVAVAHPGQILVSSSAHAAMTEAGSGTGARFLTLGPHHIFGIDGQIPLFQLLTGSSEESFPPLAVDRVPLPIPGRFGFNPAGYELREAVGDGSVGVLHRGYHPATGREVTVEVIRPDIASSPGFIRRFEADVRRLSLLQHPNLLPILDYWRDEEGAFIVYPTWRGGPLSRRLDSVHRERVVDQVCSALAYAHSLGVAHGALSPERVILDESGNAYVFGFPVGGLPTTAHPGFLPPDGFAEAPSVAGDIYAFALLARAVEEGVLPDPDLPTPSREELTGGAGSITEALAFLRTGVFERSQVSTPPRNPFKGLAPFVETDAGQFFGRTDLTTELVDAVARSPLVAVVGPSGVGKSSVVRAGLIPAIRAGSIPGSEMWLVTDIFPSDDPFRELIPAISRVATILPGSLRERLVERDPAALDGVTSVLPDESTLLLVVDQFEEVFTLCDEETRLRFLEMLGRAAGDDGVRVVLTMRADFLDEALRYSEFGALIRERMVAVSAPTPAQIGEAVRKPTELAGVGVESDLIDLVVADVHDRPGALPLMQHALSAAFEARRGDVLDVDSYTAVGRVEGSVARHAETVWSRLETSEQKAMRQVLIRLVAFSEDSAPMRRRARWFELSHLDAWDPIDTFVNARLLVTDIDPDTRAPTLEVVHESLFTSWPRLGTWIEELRDDITMSRRLDASLAEWMASDRDPDHLLTGGRLAQHQEWTEGSDLTITQPQQEFLEASAAHDAEQRRSRRQRRVMVMMGLGVVAVVAALFGLSALRSAREAKAEELAAAARAVLNDDAELGVLLGIEALELDPNSNGAMDALHVALQSHRTVFARSYPAVPLGSLSPNGDLLAVALPDQLVELWSVDQPEIPVWATDSEQANVVYAYFNETGSRMYVYGDDPVSGDSGLRVFDVGTQKELSDDFISFGDFCTIPGAVLGTSDGFVHDSAPMLLYRYEYLPEADDCLWDPPASLVALDPSTGEFLELGTFDTTGIVTPTMSDDGSRYAAAAQFSRSGGVYEYPANKLIRELPSGVATLNRDGSLVLAGGDPMFLMDVDTGDVLASYVGNYTVAYFSADESLVVAASLDGAARVFDTRTGAMLAELRGPASRPVSVQISADGSLVSTFSGDGSARVWDVSASAFPTGPATEYEHEGRSAAGHAVLASGQIYVPVFDDAGFSTLEYDRSTGMRLRALSGVVLASAQDGSFVVRQRADGPFEVVDLESGAPLQVLEGPCDPFVRELCGEYPDPWVEQAVSGAVSPGGDYFAMGGLSGYAVVWDIASGEIVAAFEGERLVGTFGAAGAVVEFSPDGSQLVVALVGTDAGMSSLSAVDTTSWQVVDRISLFQPLTEVEYAVDGTLIVGSDLAANTVLVDRETWDEMSPLEGQQGGSLADVDVSPSGLLVATGSGQGEVWVWDLERMRVRHRLDFPVTEGRGGVVSVEFVDEQTLLVTGVESSVLVTLDAGTLLDTARSHVTRDLTAQECETYGVETCEPPSAGS